MCLYTAHPLQIRHVQPQISAQRPPGLTDVSRDVTHPHHHIVFSMLRKSGPSPSAFSILLFTKHLTIVILLHCVVWATERSIKWTVILHIGCPKILNLLFLSLYDKKPLFAGIKECYSLVDSSRAATFICHFKINLTANCHEDLHNQTYICWCQIT